MDRKRPMKGQWGCETIRDTIHLGWEYKLIQYGLVLSNKTGGVHTLWLWSLAPRYLPSRDASTLRQNASSNIVIKFCSQ